VTTITSIILNSSFKHISAIGGGMSYAITVIVLYFFIVQVDRTQLILHTNDFPYIVYL